MRCSKCGQKIPIIFCPLLKTDCMKMKKKDLLCGKYPSPQCSNDKGVYNWSKESDKRCGNCGNAYHREGGIKRIKIMVCKISGAMVIPIQSCHKPEKWWKEKK